MPRIVQVELPEPVSDVKNAMVQFSYPNVPGVMYPAIIRASTMVYLWMRSSQAAKELVASNPWPEAVMEILDNDDETAYINRFLKKVFMESKWRERRRKRMRRLAALNSS